MITTRSRVLLGVMLSIGFASTRGHAQVNINVRIGEPPPVVVYSPPTMVLMPEPQMYVAVGVPYDIYFISGRYYYLHESHWFWGPAYGGPWTFVAVEKLPPGLRKYKIKQLREFRDREYQVYKVQGPRSKNTYFIAEGKDGNHQGNNGKGKGRGRGRKD